MRSMRGLWKALEAQGKANQALEAYCNAYKGLLNSLGPDHIATMESKTLLQTLLDKIPQNNRDSYSLAILIHRADEEYKCR
ncbi:hypothetical protein F5884DRAFT_109511 [Xylogone sp. PMI_703]|nr:hypothetical protein F5884DRAFT_109511 [Xylogone sp. PMI_703]